MIFKHLDNLIELFRLKDWDIDLTIGNCQSEAQTMMMYNCYKADIVIDKNLNEEQQLQSLIHELVHIVMRNTQTIEEENVDEKLHPMWKREMERETEKIAMCIYKLYTQNKDERKEE